MKKQTIAQIINFLFLNKHRAGYFQRDQGNEISSKTAQLILHWQVHLDIWKCNIRLGNPDIAHLTNYFFQLFFFVAIRSRYQSFSSKRGLVNLCIVCCNFGRKWFKCDLQIAQCNSQFKLIIFSYFAVKSCLWGLVRPYTIAQFKFIDIFVLM